MANVLTFDNIVFSQYVFYSVIVLLKMVAMAVLTGRRRISGKVYSNPEDIKARYGDNAKIKPIFDDPDVERARRNHLNDLENIPLFIFLGLFYVLSNPSPFYAALHFRVFAGSRILHTFGYQTESTKLRGIGFGAGLIVCLSIAVQLLLVASF